MNGSVIGGKLYALAMFCFVSILAGLLVAGLAVPFAQIGGMSGRMAANSLQNLPAEMETPPAPIRSTVYLADGSILAEFFEENRIETKLADIAPVMIQAQLAIEDHRFYEHGALDLTGTLRALLTNSAGGNVQGGSTLTQQYVKQVQIGIANAAGDKAGVAKAQERTLSRKIQELRYAIAMEDKFSKDQILERYLNIAYYGDGAYGVEAAARHYFGVSAKDLNLSQAAMLAGLVQNPNATDPRNNPNAAINRRNIVLNRMADLGQIQINGKPQTLPTQAQVDEAKKIGFDKSKIVPVRNGCVGTRYPFLCDYVRRTLLNNPNLGQTRSERESLLNRGGLKITTMIDPAAQDAAQETLSAKVLPVHPVITTSVLIEPGTGLIVAMAQNRPVMGTNQDVGETYYNYAVEQKMGGAEGYQAGSTFKAFTLATALDQGIPTTKKLAGTGPLQFKGQTFRTCDSSFKFNQDYEVRNSTGNYGEIDMFKAAQQSVNTFFLQLEQITGICQAAAIADAAGVKMANGKSLKETYKFIPSFTLGVAEVTPISMAVAYATFAARGVRCDPIIVKSIASREGKPIGTQSANCVQVMRPEVADGVNAILSTVMTDGTGRIVRTADRRPQAGKTGTIDSNAAVWFAGYTPALAGVTMIAVDKDPRFKAFWDARGGSLKSLTLPGTGWNLQGSGSGDAGEIWKPTMQAALANRPGTDFVAPTDEILKGKKADLPDLKGKGFNDVKATLEGLGFTVKVVRVYSNSPVGTYLPPPQCEGYVGGTCTLQVSMGQRPPDPPPADPNAPQPPGQPGG
ncbi:MAG TPA: transglycosylase domain-containing protein [Propionibacteriaceae bacterium]|nr:transglycosylase domain-containing protein [Propionibacteriaceae bacterium]